MCTLYDCAIQSMVSSMATSTSSCGGGRDATATPAVIAERMEAGHQRKEGKGVHEQRSKGCDAKKGKRRQQDEELLNESEDEDKDEDEDKMLVEEVGGSNSNTKTSTTTSARRLPPPRRTRG